MSDLETRAIRKRVVLARQFTYPVLIEHDEPFEIIDSHVETGQVVGNVWQRKPQCIASIDYAKRVAGILLTAQKLDHLQRCRPRKRRAPCTRCVPQERRAARLR